MKRCNEESLGRHIYITAQEMRNFAERLLKPYELTLEQFHLLKNMSLVDGLTQRQICNLTSKTPANMSRMLDRMESKSLVARRVNPVDRRASLVIVRNALAKIARNTQKMSEELDK
jgi:DNA-binding MarR family transcriptional regulator